MAKSKSAKTTGRRTVTLARAKTEKTDVASPTVAGATEYVDKVVDLLAQIYNRRGISQIQFAAGERYRTSFEMLSASAGGAGDFDRVRSAGGEPGGMAIGYVQAAGLVRDAKEKILYPRDYAVLHRVCVEGKTFDRVAKELSASDLGVKFDEKEVSYMFKAALSQLAAAWWPDKVPKIDQSTLEHFAEESGLPEDGKQFLEFGTADWDRVQNYRTLKGLPPIVPLVVRRTKEGEQIKGVYVQADTAKLTASIVEKSTVGEAETVEPAGKVAHATAGKDGGVKVYYSNNERGNAGRQRRD